MPSRQCLCQCMGKLMLMIVCFITGQYIPPVKNPRGANKSRCCSLFWLVYFVTFTVIILPMNIFPTIMMVWLAAHPLEYYGVSYSIVLYGPDEDSTAIPDIVFREINGTYESLARENHADSGTSLNSTYTKPSLVSFEFFSQVTVSLSSFSGSLSYFFFCILLARVYVYPHLLNIFNKYDGSAKPILHPFNNEHSTDKTNINTDVIGTDREPSVHYQRRSVYMDRFTTYESINIDEPQPQHPTLFEDNDTSTRLEPKENMIFIAVFLANIALNIILFALFAVYGLPHSGQDKKLLDGSHNASYYTKIEKWEWATSASYIYALLSSIASCFIFSKVAYGVRQKSARLVDCMDDLNKPKDQLQHICNFNDTVRSAEGEGEGDFRLDYLKQRDSRFIEITKNTLGWFEVWFFIHWVLYVATSVFSFGLFIQAISLKIKAESQSSKGIDFSGEEIGLIGVFFLSNSVFFLYPCFRAAAITESRSYLIRKVNKKRGLQHISQDLVKGFEQYLKSQEFSFNFRLLCFKVPFGYKMAVGSVFLALLGLIVKATFH